MAIIPIPNNFLPLASELINRDKDMQFMQIEKQIELKRRFLLKQQKRVNDISRQNIFLEEVKSDYDKYYHYVAKQKREQIKALELLDSYITDLTNSASLSVYNIRDAKQEQKKIMAEINSIKTNLDHIVNETNELAFNSKNNKVQNM